MATPTKNFTDLGYVNFTIPVPSVIIPSNRYVNPIESNSATFITRKLPIILVTYGGIELVPVRIGYIPEMPKPPVGKLVISTFPPIYKERINVIGLPDCPRVYPPILFRKIG